MCNTINAATGAVGPNTNEATLRDAEPQAAETPAADLASIERQMDVQAENRANPAVVPDEAVKTLPTMGAFKDYQAEKPMAAFGQIARLDAPLADKFQMLSVLLTENRADDIAPKATENFAADTARALVIDTLVAYAKANGIDDHGIPYLLGRLQFAGSVSSLEKCLPDLLELKALFEAKPDAMAEVREIFDYLEKTVDRRFEQMRELASVRADYKTAATPEACQAVVDRLEALMLPDPDDPMADAFTPAVSKPAANLVEGYRDLSLAQLEATAERLDTLSAAMDEGRFDFKADARTLEDVKKTLGQADGSILASDVAALADRVKTLDDRLSFVQTFEGIIKTVDANTSYLDAQAVRQNVDRLLEAYPGAEPHYQAAAARADAAVKLVRDRAMAGEELFLHNIRAQIRPGNLAKVLWAVNERRDQIFDSTTVGLSPDDVAKEFDTLREIELQAQYAEFESVMDAVVTSESTPKTLQELSGMIQKAAEEGGPIEDEDAFRMQANLRQISKELAQGAMADIEGKSNALNTNNVTLAELYRARDKGIVFDTSRLLPEDRVAVQAEIDAYEAKLKARLSDAAAEAVTEAHPALSADEITTFVRLYETADYHAGMTAAVEVFTPDLLDTLGKLMESKAGLSSADDRSDAIRAADGALRRLGDENPALRDGLTEIRKLCSSDPDRVAIEEKSDAVRHELKMLLDSRFRDGKLEALGFDPAARSLSADELKTLVEGLAGNKDLHQVDLLILKALHDEMAVSLPNFTWKTFEDEVPAKYRSLPLATLFADGLESTAALEKAKHTAMGFSHAATVGLHLNDEMLAVGRRLVAGDDKFAASSALNMLSRHVMKHLGAKDVAAQTHSKDFDGHKIFNNAFTSHRKGNAEIGRMELAVGLWKRMETLSSLDKTKTQFKTLTGSLDKTALELSDDQIDAFVGQSDALQADLDLLYKDFVAKGVMVARSAKDPVEVEMMTRLSQMRAGRPEIARLQAGESVPIHGARVGMAMLILDRVLAQMPKDPKLAQSLASRLSFQRHINLDTMESTSLHAKMEDHGFHEKLKAFLTAKTDEGIKAAGAELQSLMTKKQVVDKAHTVLYFKDFGSVTDAEAFESAFERALSLRGRASVKDFAAVKADLFPADRVAEAARQGEGEAARGAGEPRRAMVAGHRNNLFEQKAYRDAQQREIQKMNGRIAQSERVFNVRVKNEMRNAAKLVLLETFLSYPDAKSAKDIIDERGLYPDITRMPFYQAALDTASKLSLENVTAPYLMAMIADLKETTFQKMESDIGSNIRIKWDSFKTRMTSRSRDERVGFRLDAMTEMAGGALSTLRAEPNKTFTLDVDRRAGNKGLVPVFKEKDGPQVNARLAIAQKNGLSLFSDGADGFTLLLTRAGGVEVSASVKALKDRVNASLGGALKGHNGVELHFADAERCQRFMGALLSSQLEPAMVTDLTDRVTPMRNFGMEGRARLQVKQSVPDFVVKPVEEKLRNRHSLEAIDPNEKRARADKTALSAHLAVNGEVNWTSKHIGNDIERTRESLRHFDAAVGLTRHSQNPSAGPDLMKASYRCDFTETETLRHGPDRRLKSAVLTRSANTARRAEVEAFLTKMQVPAACRADVLFRAAAMDFKCKLESIARLPKSLLETNPGTVHEDDYVRENIRLTGVDDEAKAKKGFLLYHRHFDAKNASVYLFNARD